MLRRFTLTLALLTLPAVASAQTLTVEIEGEILTEAAPVEAAIDEPALNGVVLIRPLEDEPVAATDAPLVRVPITPRVIPPTPRGSRPRPAPDVSTETHHEDLSLGPEAEWALRMGVTLESWDFGSHTLRMGRPDVAMLSGTELDRDWQAENAFELPPLVGFEAGVGMRAHGILRGPEIRFGVFGTEVDGVTGPAPGNPAFDLTVTNMVGLRAELTMGLQADLGPVIPYVQGRLIGGVAFVDVDVVHDGLGGLGTETIEVGFGQLGVEAGMDVEIEDGLSLGIAYRGAWIGPESHGAIMTFSGHAE
ncbi:MAG: hypothetical protein AB8I08_27615 [Sandaracinaceae bacterium]